MNKDEIYSLLPENLKKYRNLSGMAYAMSEQVSKDNSSMDSLKIYLNMKNLDDKVLDQLAWQWNVEFYSSELPKSKKIEMINRSYFHHITKGTVGALESALKITITNVKVEEWYEYGGNPYMFKILIEGRMLTEKEMQDVHQIVEIYKNARSHLESLSHYEKIVGIQNYSYASFVAESLEYIQDVRKFKEINNKTNYGYSTMVSDNVEYKQERI